MVARKSAKERAKLRRRNEQLIRRSPILSLGAKILWLELSAWAWDDPTCYPKQDLLVLALGKNRTTITRWAKELQGHNLITICRQRRGNEYVLCEEIPPGVCDSARGSNKNLVRMVREDCEVDETQHQETEIVRPDVAEMQHSDVAEMQQDPPSHVAEMQHSDVAKMQHPIDEVHQEEVHQEKRSGTRGSTSDPRSGGQTFPSELSCGDERARSARSGETEALDEKQGTYVPENPEPLDPSELMEDPPVKKQHKRSKRKKRGASDALVGQPSGRTLRNAGKPRDGTKVVEPESPATWTPESVLTLLRGEVEEKYGSKAIGAIPLNLSGADTGKLKRAVMAKYPPDVVMAMVRVLVWDWEIARVACFPYRPQVAVPTIEALVQYQETLASAINSGLKYDGGVRGTWETYANRYLASVPGADSEDPF